MRGIATALAITAVAVWVAVVWPGMAWPAALIIVTAVVFWRHRDMPCDDEPDREPISHCRTTNHQGDAR